MNQPDDLVNGQQSPPTLFGERFEILETLGRGSRSIVYRAREIMLDREVALKVLDKSSEAGEKSRRRFFDEARAASLLQHPNIVRIHSIGETREGDQFIVMEFLAGKTLEAELREHGALDVEQFGGIFLPVVDALAYAHEKDIVHRDLKPGNIMVLREGFDSMTARVKVLDFGVAKILDSAHSEDHSTLELCGTPLYMSPEQCTGGRIDRRSDIYSLACVMYESVCGQPPFTGSSSVGIMYEHLNSSVPALFQKGNRDMPLALCNVIVQSLSKDPSCRPQTMSQLAEMLRQALKDGRRREGAAGAGLKYTLAVVFLLMTFAFVFFCGSLRPEKLSDRAASTALLPRKESIHYSDRLVAIKEAEILRENGQAAAALKKSLAALRDREREPGRKEWLFDAHMELAYDYSDLKQIAAAKREYMQAINTFSSADSANRLGGVDMYANWLVNTGFVDEAVNLWRRELARSDKFLAGGSSPNVAAAHSEFAVLLLGQKRYKESLQECKKSLRLYDKLSFRVDGNCVHACFCYLDCCKVLGGTKDAALELQKTYAQLAANPDARVLLIYATLAAENGMDSEALAAYKLILENLQERSPEDEKVLAAKARAGLARLTAKMKLKIHAASGSPDSAPPANP